MLLDVRRDDERTTGYIAGSAHVPMHMLLEKLDTLPAGQLWAHCASGYCASIAASLLDRAGHHRRVHHDLMAYGAPHRGPKTPADARSRPIPSMTSARVARHCAHTQPKKPRPNNCSVLPANERHIMTLHLGDDAPDFTADTTQGTIKFYDWLGDSWGVLFSHPGDFTPVCTTELGTVARLKGEFDRRNTKVIGLSVDSVQAHEKWERDIGETQGTAVNFPMIADTDHKVSMLYDMIHPNASETSTIRSVFVISPTKKISLNLAYPMATGRNFPEILRAIDSLQLTEAEPVATPADWQPGQDVIIGLGVSDADAAQRFPGYRTIKPYLRLTPDPTA